jgi:hypothetical protein
VTALLPLFLLSVPGVVLLGIVLVPLAALAVPVALAVALLVGLPYLLVRAIRRPAASRDSSTSSARRPTRGDVRRADAASS